MFKHLWQKWANKRFRFDETKKLTQKDILVFIYKQGYLYLVLILITFIAGINYANNLILGFCFLISSILCLSFYITFKQLHGLKISVVLPPVGQVGENIELELYFEQETKQTRFLWVEIDSHVQKLKLDNIKHKLVFDIYASSRGKLYFPNVRIHSTYPFGLVRAWSYLYPKYFLWIAPKPIHSKFEPKNNKTNNQQDIDEFSELKNYREGDSLHLISWKHVARGQGLFVKIFEEQEQNEQLRIMYERMPAHSHEDKLSQMMGLAEHCYQLNLGYSLELPNQALAQGLGEKHLEQVKLMLAKV
jgi:uncharacterized protein (DUF58 family)